MTILYTPQTPRPKFLPLLLAVWLATCNLGNAQFVKLEPLPEYEQSLQAFHTTKVRTQCVEFQASTKKKWWYYLPTIGYSFGLPSINGGTNQFVQLDQQKQQNRVKLQAIISQGNLDYRIDLHQLRSMYEMLKIEQDAIDELKDSQQTQEKIFAVANEAHQKKEIKPSEYYQALLTRQRDQAANRERQRQYEIRIIELARFARHQFPVSAVLPGVDYPGSDSSRTASAPSPAHRP